MPFIFISSIGLNINVGACVAFHTLYLDTERVSIDGVGEKSCRCISMRWGLWTRPILTSQRKLNGFLDITEYDEDYWIISSILHTLLTLFMPSQCDHTWYMATKRKIEHEAITTAAATLASYLVPSLLCFIPTLSYPIPPSITCFLCLISSPR